MTERSRPPHPVRRSPLPRRRNRRGEGDLLRTEILQAAERLLRTSGDEDAVSIRAIASEVGVTPPSIYIHFRDKTELILAVCEELFRRLGELSDEAVAGVEDPYERVERRGRAYVQFGIDNPEPYRIMFMARPDAGHARMTADELLDTAAFGHLQMDLTAAMEMGRIPHGDPFTMSCGLWAAVHGVTSLLIAKPDFPWPPMDAFIDASAGWRPATGSG